MSTPDNRPPDLPSWSGSEAFRRYQLTSPPPARDEDRRPTAGRGPDPDTCAGFWIRLLGVVIDGLLLVVVTGLIDRVLTAGAAVGFLVAGAYFTYFHSTPAGQTFGNRMCAIRVVDSNSGGHLDHGHALLRWLVSYLSGAAMFVGYLWMLWDPAKQTWHDKVAGSFVVKASAYPPPAGFGKPASSTGTP